VGPPRADEVPTSKALDAARSIDPDPDLDLEPEIRMQSSFLLRRDEEDLQARLFVMLYPAFRSSSPRVRAANAASALLAAVLALSLSLAGATASAATPTKEECVETHSRAQDSREKGQLVDAKRLFLLCAQQTCPALIQSDCAKFGEDISRSLPSVSFSARDGKGNDLPDAQVFIDGLLVASRLDDGKAHDVDPGKHNVRFVRGSKEATVSVVFSVGERGRNIGVTLGDPGAPVPSASFEATPSVDATRKASRPLLPLVVAGAGGVALVTGAVLGVVGLSKVPGQCTTSPRECAAPPGDKVFSDAKSAVNLANVGLGVGIAGLVIGVGGLIWYLTSGPPSAPSTNAARLFTNSADGAVRFAF
jgi:hypothetical protein